jgi:hypothetical protein
MPLPVEQLRMHFRCLKGLSKGTLAFTLPHKSSSLLDASYSTGKGIYIGKGIKLHLHSPVSTGKGKTTPSAVFFR